MSEQGSLAWKQERCGKVTASRIADMMAKTKSGWGASRANYLAELVAERLTGTPAESFTNAAMAWGTATEPEARAAYAFAKNVEVEQVGFVPHPTIPMAGCSPDGLVAKGDYGLIEIKCPSTATHINTLLGTLIADKYLLQMHWQMACCPEREWCDWVSYDPRMPEEHRLFIARVMRDDKIVAELEKQVTIFLAEVDEKIAALKARLK